MQSNQVIVITADLLPELAKELAEIMKGELSKTSEDSYMTPAQLAEVFPVLSKTMIQSQIRDGKYGKKYGTKGRLTAKPSEVKKFNRL